MPAAVDAPPTTPRKAPTAGGPTTMLTVPAKPAAVTAANVATLAGTAVMAAGPVGWAVAAVAGAVGTGVVVRRVVRRRGGGGGLGSFRPLRLGRGGVPRATTAGRIPSARTAAGRRAGLGLPSLARAAGGAGGGRKPSPYPRSVGTRAQPAGLSAGRGGRQAAGGARAAGRLPCAPAGSPAGRQATAAARRAWRVSRSVVRRLRRPARLLWGWLRRVVRRRVLGVDRDAQAPAKTAGPKLATGATVRRPPAQVTAPRGTSTDTREPAIMPKPPVPQGPIYDAARRVHAAAAEHTPRGNLEVRVAAYEAPYAIAEVASAYEIVAQACQRQAIRPEWAAAVAAIAAQLRSAADAARRLGPGFDDLHKELVRRLLAPNVGEEGWDLANNR